MVFHRLRSSLTIAGHEKTINTLVLFINCLELCFINHAASAHVFHQVLDGLDHTDDHHILRALGNAEMKIKILLQKLFIIPLHISLVQPVGGIMKLQEGFLLRT